MQTHISIHVFAILSNRCYRGCAKGHQKPSSEIWQIKFWPCCTSVNIIKNEVWRHPPHLLVLSHIYISLVLIQFIYRTAIVSTGKPFTQKTQFTPCTFWNLSKAWVAKHYKILPFYNFTQALPHKPRFNTKMAAVGIESISQRSHFHLKFSRLEWPLTNACQTYHYTC